MAQLDSDGNENAEWAGKMPGCEVSVSAKLRLHSNGDALATIKEEKVYDFDPISDSCDALDRKVDSLVSKGSTPDSSFTMLEAAVHHSAEELENIDNTWEDYKDGCVKKSIALDVATDEVDSVAALIAKKRDFLEAIMDPAASAVDNDRNGGADSFPLCSGSQKTDELFQLEAAGNHHQNLAIVKKDDSMEDSTSDKNMEKEKNLVNASSSRAAGGKLAVPRTSIYHGVTRHRWSGKYEAHLWDSTCRLEGRRRKGKQVYLGSYDTEEKAARSYDVAALKYWGAGTKLNFPISQYEKELDAIRDMSKDECITYLRRRSSCFSRGASVYRGVTRQRDGRWQARIGRVAGNKDIYLGTFKTEEEAAEAYDIAAIELRGMSAITNFDISNYCEKGLGLGLALEDEEEEEGDGGK